MKHSKILFICLAVFILTLTSGCTTDYPNKKPVGKMFPRVTGQSLEKEVVTFPEHISGKNVVLLLGYVQNSQFDIDRWLIGLDMTKT